MPTPDIKSLQENTLLDEDILKYNKVLIFRAELIKEKEEETRFA
jgi:hypothetical protein